MMMNSQQIPILSRAASAKAAVVRDDFTGARHDLWQLARNPATASRPAVTDGAYHFTLSYESFCLSAGRLALCLARHLQQTGMLSPDTCVAVTAPRGAVMCVEMWAVMLAGCVYTPLNPTLPADSMHFILTNTKAAAVLTSASTFALTDSQPRALTAQAIPSSCVLVGVDEQQLIPVASRFGDRSDCLFHTDLWPDVSAMSLDEVYTELQALLPQTLPSHSAYYIHTSGSTGRPKCVHHVHSALDWHTHKTLIGSGLCRNDDVIFQVADCSFDLHIRDIFCGLSFGGHIVTIPPEALLDMDLFSSLMQRYSVNWLECVPLLLAACVDYLASTQQWQRLATVRCWSCIGAPFQIRPAQRAHAHLPNLMFYNSYAPTENSLVTTCHKLTEYELTQASAMHAVPIGTIVPGWVCDLLDETEDPAGIKPPSLAVISPKELSVVDGRKRSASGVVYVRGPGVFVGYLNRPDLTELAMLRKHELLGNAGANQSAASSATPHGSLFRSGDVCHYDENGELVFEGRRDLQIKLRGQRLEPGEIEVVLMTNPIVKMAVVRKISPKPEQPEFDYLCAYLTLVVDEEMFPGLREDDPSLQVLPGSASFDLHALCEKTLPAFMRPSLLVICQKMPRTMSGKIDRLSLQPPTNALLNEARAVQERAIADAAKSNKAGLKVDTTQSEQPPLVRVPSTPIRRSRFVELQRLIAELALPNVDWDVSTQGPLPTDRQLTELGLTSLRLTRLISAVRLKLQPSLSLGMVLRHRVVSVDTLAAAVLEFERKQNPGMNRSNSIPETTPGGPSVAPKTGRATSYGSVAVDENGETIEPADWCCSSSMFTCAQIMIYLFRLGLLAVVVVLWRSLSESARVWLGVADDAWITQAFVMSVMSLLAAVALFFSAALIAWVMVFSFKVLRPSDSTPLPAEFESECFDESCCDETRRRFSSDVLVSISQPFGASTVRTIPVRSFDHFVLWSYSRLVHMALAPVSFLQGTELYNVCLRLFGSKIAVGSVLFAVPDLPCLFSVGAHTMIAKTARMRTHQLSMVRGDRDVQVVRVGEVRLSHHVYVSENCTLMPGATVMPFSRVRAGSTLHRGDEPACIKKESRVDVSTGEVWGLDTKTSPIRLFLQSIAMLVIFVPFGLALNTLLLWPILSLNLVFFYVFAVLFLPAAAILFVLFERILVGSVDSNQIIAIGSWTWFRQQVIHHATLLVWGYPLFAFQSSHFPTDLLRLAGADIGPRSIHFSKDPAFELSTTPLSLLSIGSDALITTYAILNCQNIRCGQWMPNAIQIGRGCLIGNNSLLELRGSSLPAHCWVGALSHAKLASTQSIDEGQVLVGRPAQPLPLKAAADLTESAAQLPGRSWLLLVSWFWAQLVRVIFPSAPEAYLVFIFFWTSTWSFAYALGIAFACLGGAILCTLLFATLIGNLMGRCVITPDNHFDMFTFKWFMFHWIDMSLLAVNANEPAFFGESEVWSWLMRLVGSDVGNNVLITDPYLVEPLLTSIGDNVVIDEGWTQPHVYSAHTLNIDHVAVCNAAELRDHSCALLLSTVGARATLAADSLLMRGERLPDGQTWQGVPALPL